jgi:serine/threonine protein kinase
MAPEIFKNEGYNLSSDVYSFGIMLWEVCALKKPFYNMTGGLKSFQKKIVEEKERPSLKNFHSDALKGLLTRCWAPNHSDRPNFKFVDEALEVVLFEERNHFLTPTRHNSTVSTYTDGEMRNPSVASQTTSSYVMPLERGAGKGIEPQSLFGASLVTLEIHDEGKAPKIRPRSNTIQVGAMMHHDRMNASCSDVAAQVDQLPIMTSSFEKSPEKKASVSGSGGGNIARLSSALETSKLEGKKEKSRQVWPSFTRRNSIQFGTMMKERMHSSIDSGSFVSEGDPKAASLSSVDKSSLKSVSRCSQLSSDVFKNARCEGAPKVLPNQGAN